MAGFADDLLLDRATSNHDLGDFERARATGLAEAERGLSGQLTAIERLADRRDEEQNVAKAETAALKSTDLDASQFERQTRSLGATARQRAGARKQFSLSRSLARATAAGRERRLSTGMAKAAGRTAASFSDLLRQQRQRAESQLAGEFTTGKIDEIDRASKKKSSKYALIGKILGFGASFIGG